MGGSSPSDGGFEAAEPVSERDLGGPRRLGDFLLDSFVVVREACHV